MEDPEEAPICPDCGKPETLAPGLGYFCDNDDCPEKKLPPEERQRRSLEEALKFFGMFETPPEPFDFRAFLERKAAFSLKTFGPGLRVKGLIDHIQKELKEIESSEGKDPEEWVDVVFLALDGLRRSGVDPDGIIAWLIRKQDKNEARTWPDWRTVSPDKAIEHDRSDEGGQDD